MSAALLPLTFQSPTLQVYKRNAAVAYHDPAALGFNARVIAPLDVADTPNLVVVGSTSFMLLSAWGPFGDPVLTVQHLDPRSGAVIAERNPGGLAGIPSGVLVFGGFSALIQRDSFALIRLSVTNFDEVDPMTLTMRLYLTRR